jgi:hypothetical protein
MNKQRQVVSNWGSLPRLGGDMAKNEERQRVSDLENMKPAQALTIAVLVLQFEAESAPVRSSWASECKAAIKVIRQNFNLENAP